MDAFRMYFHQHLVGEEISDLLRNAGFDLGLVRPREVHIVGSGDGYVWLDLSPGSDVGSEDLADCESWPVPLERLGTLIAITVRRNDASSDLAVRAAHRLARQFGGLITWDGMFYWENMYKSYAAAQVT